MKHIKIDLQSQQSVRKLGPFEWMMMDGMHLYDDADDVILSLVTSGINRIWQTSDGQEWDAFTIYTVEIDE